MSVRWTVISEFIHRNYFFISFFYTSSVPLYRYPLMMTLSVLEWQVFVIEMNDEVRHENYTRKPIQSSHAVWKDMSKVFVLKNSYFSNSLENVSVLPTRREISISACPQNSHLLTRFYLLQRCNHQNASNWNINTTWKFSHFNCVNCLRFPQINRATTTISRICHFISK